MRVFAHDETPSPSRTGARCRGHALSVRQLPGGGHFTEGECFAGTGKKIEGGSRDEDSEGSRGSRSGRGPGVGVGGQCATCIHQAQPGPEGEQRRLPAPEPERPVGHQLPGELPVPRAVPGEQREPRALPHPPPVRRPDLDQLHVRGRRRREPAHGGWVGRLRRALGVPLQDPRARRPGRRQPRSSSGRCSILPTTRRTRPPYSGADYYEIGLHEANGFQGLAAVGLFPKPPAARPVPNGMQWTGLTCNIVGGCSCPADASQDFRDQILHRAAEGSRRAHPLFTPIWGVGQINMGGGPVTSALGPASPGEPRPGRATATSPPGRRSASAAPPARRWS